MIPRRKEMHGLPLILAVCAVGLGGCSTISGPRWWGPDRSKWFVTALDKQFVLTPCRLAGRTCPAHGEIHSCPHAVFTPWGANYDRTVIDGRDVLLEDVLQQRPDKIAKDFAAMRRYRINTVRVFVATGEILSGPAQVNEGSLQQLDLVIEAARRNHLRLILTGLANIRPATMPAWMRDADDDTMEQAEVLFWQAVARHCKDEPVILAYDLQNEPVIHWADSDEWVTGCFDMSGGQKFCYVHQHYRRPGRRWTEHVQRQFGDEETLRRHWRDYPREGESWSAIAIPRRDPADPRHGEYWSFHAGLMTSWAQRLASAIRAEDPGHLVTIGALFAPIVPDVVDFHCVHMYPQPLPDRQQYLAVNAQRWRQMMSALPADKPVMIEEFYPMFPSQGLNVRDVLQTMLTATRDRAAGWVSFYWGPVDELNWPFPPAKTLYEQWLAAWRDSCPVR